MKDSELLVVIQGRIDGKVIERSCVGVNTWYRMNATGEFETNAYKYRIKPEPKCLYDVCLPNGRVIIRTADLAEAEEHRDTCLTSSKCTITKYTAVPKGEE